MTKSFPLALGIGLCWLVVGVWGASYLFHMIDAHAWYAPALFLTAAAVLVGGWFLIGELFYIGSKK